jgi:hypothetical protein
MQLEHDQALEKAASPHFGKYLGTFISAQGQVRADLFDNGPYVIAYISFPTGRNATNVEDRYVAILEGYAAAQGFSTRFHMIHAA